MPHARQPADAAEVDAERMRHAARAWQSMARAALADDGADEREQELATAVLALLSQAEQRDRRLDALTALYQQLQEAGWPGVTGDRPGESG